MISTLFLVVLAACKPESANPSAATPAPNLDADADGYRVLDGDCDDADPTVHPAGIEVCDTLNRDEDCDGLDDDADPSVDPATRVATYADLDGDQFGGAALASVCDPTPGTVATPGDCNDLRADVSPAATEVCDPAATDEDCDGLVDDADPSVQGQLVAHADTDLDGFGDPLASVVACTLPDGLVADATDCDDSRADVHPLGVEVCDADDTDEDCDGQADDADPEGSGAPTWYADADADGFGAGEPAVACDAPPATSPTSGDCDDLNGAVHPLAIEVCDALVTDEDCSGAADDADPAVSGLAPWYADADGDGFGDASSEFFACLPPAGTTADANDCNDAVATIHPDAAEVCDAADVDEDCDGQADDADSGGADGGVLRYLDTDGDGFGDDMVAVTLCDPTEETVAIGGDCNDRDAASYPFAEEILCDGVAQNCVGKDGDFIVPSELPNLDLAVAVAHEGDVICVEAGTYDAPVIDQDHISILSIAGSAATTLQPFLGRGVEITGAEGVTLRGFTILGGDAENGGALAATSSDDVTLEDLVIIGGTATVYGGGVFLHDLHGAALTDVEVTGGTAAYGGGIAVWAAEDAVFTRVESHANTAELGGGLVVYDASDIQFVDSELSENTATSTGGGAWVSVTDDFAFVRSVAADNEGSGLYLVLTDGASIEDSVLSGNESGSGAGLALAFTDRTEVSGTTIVGNLATLYGGGLCTLLDSETTLSNSTFSANSATLAGGHVYLGAANEPVLDDVDLLAGTSKDGGGLYITATWAAEIRGGRIADNVATSGGGGAAVFDSDDVVFSDVVVETNQATVGGGIGADTTHGLEVTRVDMANNASTGDGGGLYVLDSTDLAVGGGTYVGNTSGIRGGAIHVKRSIATEIVGVDVVANDATVAGGGVMCTDGDLATLDGDIEDNGPDDIACTACGGCEPR